MSTKQVSAFPLMGSAPEDGAPIEQHGMTLRDYFAAHALAGMLANRAGTYSGDVEAGCAYDYADAMLRERAKK